MYAQRLHVEESASTKNRANANNEWSAGLNPWPMNLREIFNKRINHPDMTHSSNGKVTAEQYHTSANVSSTSKWEDSPLHCWHLPANDIIFE